MVSVGFRVSYQNIGMLRRIPTIDLVVVFLSRRFYCGRLTPQLVGCTSTAEVIGMISS